MKPGAPAALVVFITASVITYPAFLHRPAVLLAMMLGSYLVPLGPLGLEVADAIPRTWEGPPALVTLVLASAATVVMAGIQSVKLARANRDAQHRLVIQAWHLQQLLPARAPGP